MPELSHVHSNLNGRDISRLSLTRGQVTNAAVRELQMIGIHIPGQTVAKMVAGLGLDSNDVGIAPSPLPGLTNASIPTPIQFLQEWLPGFVRAVTAARKIDELIGLATIGSWEDEEIVQGMMEPIGTASPYGDYTNVPLATWNATYEKRTVVRFEQGMQVGILEEARTARARINTAAEKRTSAALSLDIQRNRVGFYGYNDGTNRTYGFLNDPNLPAAITVATGAGGGTSWAGKTFLEITADIQAAMAQLQLASLDTIDPQDIDLTFALPTPTIQYLTTVSQYGNSVRQWARENYPRLRFVSAPELQNAVGGVNVAYVYPDSLDDGSTDDNRVFTQMVPSKFYSLGVEKQVKAYLEDYSNATAGTLLKRPYAVIRLIGL